MTIIVALFSLGLETGTTSDRIEGKLIFVVWKLRNSKLNGFITFHTKIQYNTKYSVDADSEAEWVKF